MLAYHTEIDVPLSVKSAHFAKTQFTEDDIITALEAIFRAMLVSEFVIDEAESGHAEAFATQMARLGIDSSAMREPYLITEKLNLQLQFLNKLDTLFTRTESYLHDVQETARKTAVSLYECRFFCHGCVFMPPGTCSEDNN